MWLFHLMCLHVFVMIRRKLKLTIGSNWNNGALWRRFTALQLCNVAKNSCQKKSWLFLFGIFFLWFLVFVHPLPVILSLPPPHPSSLPHFLVPPLSSSFVSLSPSFTPSPFLPPSPSLSKLVAFHSEHRVIDIDRRQLWCPCGTDTL